jgi:hypothetical protein
MSRELSFLTERSRYIILLSILAVALLAPHTKNRASAKDPKDPRGSGLFEVNIYDRREVLDFLRIIASYIPGDYETHHEQSRKYWDTILEIFDRNDKLTVGPSEWGAWMGIIQQAYISLGFADYMVPPLEITYSDYSRFNPGEAIVYCETASMEIATGIKPFDSMTGTDAINFLQLMAHEQAHLQIQRNCAIDISQLSSNKQRSVLEASAQLLSLEVLAYMYYTNDSSITRQQAKDAFNFQLAGIILNQDRYLAYTQPESKNESRNMQLFNPDFDYYNDTDDMGGHILATYYYGRLPGFLLSEVPPDVDIRPELARETGLEPDEIAAILPNKVSLTYAHYLIEELGLNEMVELGSASRSSQN